MFLKQTTKKEIKQFINLKFINCSRRNTAVCFEKGCQKKCTRQSGKYCGWFCVTVLQRKNGTRSHGHMFRVLKESSNSSYSARNSVFIIPILPFEIVACTIFPTTFLEIAVYISIPQKGALWATSSSWPVNFFCSIIKDL